MFFNGTRPCFLSQISTCYFSFSRHQFWSLFHWDINFFVLAIPWHRHAWTLDWNDEKAEPLNKIEHVYCLRLLVPWMLGRPCFIWEFPWFSASQVIFARIVTRSAFDLQSCDGTGFPIFGEIHMFLGIVISSITSQIDSFVCD